MLFTRRSGLALIISMTSVVADHLYGLALFAGRVWFPQPAIARWRST